MRGQAIINEFSKYNNTIAFSTGNEVNHFAPGNQPEWNAPFQKKLLRDMKEYIDKFSNLRNVPIGFAYYRETRAVKLTRYGDTVL